MAIEARKKNEQFMSDKGTAVYPRLTSIDYGNDKAPKPDGEFSVRLRMSQEDAEAMVNKKNKNGKSLQEVHDENIQAATEKFDAQDAAKKKKLAKDGITGPKVKPLYDEVLDKETGDETGDVEFRFKMKASGTRKDGKKWERKPDLFDAKGRKLGKGVEIWGGSTVKVNFAASPYVVESDWKTGVSLQLNAAQVIDLISGGSRDASGYGFEEEEGYEYDPENYKEDEAEESSEGSSGDKAPADGDDDF